MTEDELHGMVTRLTSTGPVLAPYSPQIPPEEMEKLARSMVGKPVTEDGKHVGTITDAWVDDDRVVGMVTMDPIVTMSMIRKPAISLWEVEPPPEPDVVVG